MAKKTTRKKHVVKKHAPRGPKRVTTFKPNGGLPESQEVAPEKVPIGEAMRLAVEALGDVKIDDDLASSQLRQLAECYEDVTRRQTAFAAKNDEAKTAKKALEGSIEFLIERVREFTHPAALPLFDQPQAEADLELMKDGPSDAAPATA